MKPHHTNKTDTEYKLMAARIEADEASGKTTWTGKREMTWKINGIK